jgi:hypothetical protein
MNPQSHVAEKFNDVSVLHYSSITYPELLRNASLFCRQRNLSLVIKIHPHLTGGARTTQEVLIQSLHSLHPRIYVSRASINFLAANALFTATLNGGTLMDSFYTTTPVLSLARGFFSETDALISDDSAMRGMERTLAELPWPPQRRRRQRQIVCWYDRMSLKTSNTPRQNVAVLQRHIDALKLPRARQVML